jgi:diketogulonate reductase-like aldo/keto reductase
MHRRRILSLIPAIPAALCGVRVAAQPTARPSSAGVTAVATRRNLPPGFEALPPIGLGTWLTFDVGDNAQQKELRRQVLQHFFAAGGGLIDSSPMYGRAEWLLGQLLPQVNHGGKLFTETKVWTPIDRIGPVQFEQSLKLWGVPRFDVLLVHNLLNWRAHLKSLRQWKEQGRARFIGISTSHAVANDEAARIVRAEPLDVLQITYNFKDPSAESVMNLAADNGLAVVINRPFDGGNLFNKTADRPLPAWAADIDCANWAQFMLKWVIAHPAVTCAIPATRVPAHCAENMGARLGRMPDAATRVKMAALIRSL